jgi:putative protease
MDTLTTLPGNSPREEKIPELLAPAGQQEKLITAIHYGADAVYLGGPSYSLRAKAGNFDEEAMQAAITYAHAQGVKVYVTVNIFAHNRDLEDLKEYLLFLERAGADALIVADPGIVLICRETVPQLPLHLSTQANVTNQASVRFWAQQGLCRINLARELSKEEVQHIRKENPHIELEVFVHGSLCISYSGRCLLSDYLTGRRSNQGDCAHPCRYSYRLVEEKRPGEYFPVEEDQRGTYIFNSRDLCLLQQLPSLVALGVDSIKIEGRMKSTGYLAGAVRVYRAALDYIQEQRSLGFPWQEIQLPPLFQQEINKVGTRGQTENFFFETPSYTTMLYDTIREKQPYVPVAMIRALDPLLIEARNVLEEGECIEYLGQRVEPVVCTVVSMYAVDGTRKQRANPGNHVLLVTDPVLENLNVNAIFRKKMTHQQL